MAEYLEKAALVRILRTKAEMGRLSEYSVCFDNVAKMIELLPTANVEEVKHGKWEFPIFTDSDDGLDPRVKCSECGGIEVAFARWKYCPNCGAKMGLED
ncbi:MAG: hypothetical protein ACLRQY_07570 [[Clostridium] leptum]